MPRIDGRSGNELRARKAQVGVIVGCDGSVRYSQGNTSVFVSFTGPVAAKASQEQFDRAIVSVTVTRLGQEPLGGGLSKLIGEKRLKDEHCDDYAIVEMVTEILNKTIVLERYPRSLIEAKVVVLQEDGSLLSVIFNALMCALLDSSLYCKTTFAAVTVSLVESGETYLLDPIWVEEDLKPIAPLPGTRGTLAGAPNGALRAVGTFAFAVTGQLVASVFQVAGSDSSITHSEPIKLEEYLRVKSMAWQASQALFTFYRSCTAYSAEAVPGPDNAPPLAYSASSGTTML
jgi:ribonuclease PH